MGLVSSIIKADSMFLRQSDNTLVEVMLKKAEINKIVTITIDQWIENNNIFTFKYENVDIDKSRIVNVEPVFELENVDSISDFMIASTDLQNGYIIFSALKSKPTLSVSFNISIK